MENAYKILVRETDRKKLVGKPIRGSEDNTEMDFKRNRL
jgi:hypothetical protein